MDRPLGAAPRHDVVRRARLGFRAARQPRAAPSPGVARTEAPSGSGPLCGASQIADGRTLPLPTGLSPAPPRSRAPVEVWGVASASASAGVQLETAAPLYGAVSCPWWSGPCSQSLPVRHRRVSPEPAVTKIPCGPSHDHQSPVKLLVCRQLSIEPLPRCNRAHGGHRRRLPVRPIAGAAPLLSNTPNRTLVAPRPLPHPSPAKPRRTSPEFRSPAPASRPGATLRNQRSFRGPPCKRVTPIVKPFGCFL
jgi:hypothetical protein